ncbi:Hpt domain-containing protein [Stenotrophomonas sp. Iso1]|uniref:Hpt domain-containing protein n=1 Tax=Stenotrophomonas sp. Iso1 TaxID=2977283 RepID=UPI0022B7B695|nr:Hpt domain-containing protein [Stenotrophomonas sp. Iso1]
MNLTFTDKPGDHMVVPEAVREVFLPAMRSDQRRLEAAVQFQRLDVMQQMLHRIRGALMIVSAQHLADTAWLIEDAIAKGAAPEDCLALTVRFLTALDSALSGLEPNEWQRTDAYFPLPRV